MNIQISDSWLREFIETKATPKQIGEYLSLCGQSVEKIIPNGKDFIYDIEITTNRPDCLSVYGIARELAAILPRFSIDAKLKEVPSRKISIVGHSDQARSASSVQAPRVEEPLSPATGKRSLDSRPPCFATRSGQVARDDDRYNRLPLNVKIAKTDLCPRFTALVYDNIIIKPSPEFVQKRLNASGIRALNNVIDISNYLMLELGQPMHTFDYDKILKHKMILREAKEGEEIVTLDGQTRKLRDGIIIIEDGEKRIVDLCGIMGGKNSETDENTKRVLLFVQTYNPMKIRRACQLLGFRTEAAARFEKGMDPEGVIPTMERATLLFKDWCNGKIASELFDIYPNPPKVKQVSVSQKAVDKLMGIKIDQNEARDMLVSLGFITETSADTLTATVPHWRSDDITIPEDLIEEIARIYGYHNLPNVLPPITTLNKPKDPIFDWEYKIKTALKYWGFTEVMNYSLVSKKLATDIDKQLALTNPLTEDLVYLRTSLVPNLLEIIAKNKAEGQIKIFEMANVYLPHGKSELPNEVMHLTVAVPGINQFTYLKGIFEALIGELNIPVAAFKPEEIANLISEIDGASFLDLEIDNLIAQRNETKKYLPPSKYPAIVEDLSFTVPPQTQIGSIIEEIKTVDPLVKSVALLDSFQATRTFRIEYQSQESNLSDIEVRPIREEIIHKLEEKFSVRLRVI